jgi:transcriptional regulator with XRE-family HTH domain
MAREQGPTVRRRRLAAELRRLRETALLTIDQVGEKLECSASKISRIETGHVGVTPRDTRDLLELYGVEGDHREALVQLAREARKRGWWQAYAEVFSGSFIGLEADAARLHAFQALLVPGLLQTEGYSRAVLRAIRPDAPAGEVDRRVAARLARQKMLAEPDPPQYWVILDEAVLRRAVGGREVMRAQLEHLCAAAALPHVTIQVVPFDSGAHAGMEAPFLIIGFPEPADPDVIYVENTSIGAYLEASSDISRYSLMFDHLRASALGPDQSVGLITEIAARRA